MAPGRLSSWISQSCCLGICQHAVIPTTNEAVSLRRLYVLNKFDIHEYNYLAYSAGQFSDDIWAAWKNVILVDFNQVPEFREMWPAAKRFLAPSFVNFIEEHCGMVLDE